jgi:hypothetical protein
VPTFCRHNRFIERCPICSKTLPGLAPPAPKPPAGGAARRRAGGARKRRPRGVDLRVSREQRAEDDGYRSALVPGLRSSADAALLSEEISFASGRLLALGAAPPGIYAEIRSRAEEDLERATWMCFLTAYLSPLEGEQPFLGIRAILSDAKGPADVQSLEEIPLGPRTSHNPGRGSETLLAYRHWVEQAGGGSQAKAFAGDPEWSPRRRFERLFERLALPGLARMGRYDLLVTLGRLGLYELRADSLHFTARGPAGGDPTTVAAKRAFAIGDPLLLERRALALAEAIATPVETLDLALANWGAGERATLGFRADIHDNHVLERAHEALEL